VNDPPAPRVSITFMATAFFRSPSPEAGTP
jgi:hypothetical protein